MTEEIAATPGWVDERLDELFAALPPELAKARAAYSACLALRKQAGAPSDVLGTEFGPCRGPLQRAVQAAGVDPTTLGPVLDAIEAEIAAGS